RRQVHAGLGFPRSGRRLCAARVAAPRAGLRDVLATAPTAADVRSRLPRNRPDIRLGAAGARAGETARPGAENRALDRPRTGHGSSVAHTTGTRSHPRRAFPLLV